MSGGGEARDRGRIERLLAGGAALIREGAGGGWGQGGADWKPGIMQAERSCKHMTIWSASDGDGETSTAVTNQLPRPVPPAHTSMHQQYSHALSNADGGLEGTIDCEIVAAGVVGVERRHSCVAAIVQQDTGRGGVGAEEGQ